jgi:glycosyltransferase involved in cell wall biosynthesis
VSAAVVVTTHNHAHFLGDALTSVLGQSAPAAEIIVVDDGSTDSPEQVVARYPGVRMIRQDQQGLAAARNTGWRACSSPFVAFLDADDLLCPSALAVGLRQLEQHHDAAFTYAGYADFHWPSGELKPALFRPVPPDAFAHFLHINPVGMHATVLYRRECLGEIGGFAEALRACEDYDAYLRLAMHFPVACHPELIAHYRRHGSNMSADNAFMLRAALQVLQRVKGDASARGLAACHRAGTHTWKQWYIGNWARRLRTLGPNGPSVREGLTLLKLAPWEMLSYATSKVTRRMWRP